MIKILSEDPTLSLKTAAREIWIYQRIIRRPLSRELKIVPYKLQMRDPFNDEDNIKKIGFAQ